MAEIFRHRKQNGEKKIFLMTNQLITVKVCHHDIDCFFFSVAFIFVSNSVNSLVKHFNLLSVYSINNSVVAKIMTVLVNLRLIITTGLYCPVFLAMHAYVKVKIQRVNKRVYQIVSPNWVRINKLNLFSSFISFALSLYAMECNPWNFFSTLYLIVYYIGISVVIAFYIDYMDI